MNDQDIQGIKSDKSTKWQVRFNRIMLLVFTIGVIMGAVYLWYDWKMEQGQYDTLNLFYADKKYTRLIREKRKIKKVVPALVKEDPDYTRNLYDKVNLAVQHLIRGPLDYNANPLFPTSTRIINLWQVENSRIYINFSKELVHQYNQNIKDDRLIIYSLLATIFGTFPEIDTIGIYIEDEPIKAITGLTDYSPSYFTRKKFLAKIPLFINNSQELVNSLILPDNDERIP